MIEQNNELIKIIEKDGKVAVSARELYQFLEATERFSNWIERQFQYGFIENIDYVGCKEFNTLANQELMDFALTIECAKEISMLQKNDKGKQARIYFIKCEKQLQKPLSRKELALMIIESENARELAETKILELIPKVEVYENIVNADNLLTLNESAKSLGIGRNNMMEYLRKEKILLETNIPYQCYISEYYFKVKVHPIKKGQMIENYTQTFVTGKGLAWLSKRLKK